MVKWFVRELAERAGIRSAHELAKRAGLYRTSVYPIWKGTAKRADLETLARLCELLEVPVGQLLVYMPGARKSGGGPRS